MRFVLIGAICGILAACQTTTQPSVARPALAPIEGADGPIAAFESRAVRSERRVKINTCLAELGLPPLAETLGGTNAPLTVEQSAEFRTCMAKAA